MPFILPFGKINKLFISNSYISLSFLTNHSNIYYKFKKLGFFSKITNPLLKISENDPISVQ